MNDLCSNPDCAEDAGLTIQRSIDPAAVPYCLPHGYQREAELKQLLQNYQLVSVVQMPPSDLELAQARLAELEGGSEAERADAAARAYAELGEQLDQALGTLELQSKTLQEVRGELGERDESVKIMRRELERSRGELERTRKQLELAQGELALKTAALGRAEQAAGEAAASTAATAETAETRPPITPPPPTRPEP